MPLRSEVSILRTSANNAPKRDQVEEFRRRVSEMSSGIPSHGVLFISRATWEYRYFDSDTTKMNTARTTRSMSAMLRPLRAIHRWLANVPVNDAVDRRNAPMVQGILLVLVFLASSLWIYRIGFSGLPWRSGETASFLMSVCVIAVCAASVVLIRRGRFMWAIRQILLVVSVFLVLAYAQNGFDSQGYEQPIQVVWLVLAGLIVGRSTLWAMYAVLLLAFACGVNTDIANDLAAVVPSKFSMADRIGSGVIGATIFLLIALAIDRSVAALRAALREANERGDQLAVANAGLSVAIAERERVTDQLIHARKVEAVGHLASGVAHDFNHLLGLVIGYAGRGQRSLDLDEAKTTLADIDSAARRATAVAQTLLNFSRHDTSRPEVFEIDEVLVELRPMLVQIFGNRSQLEIDLAGTSAAVRFDRSQFTLVVLNVATNAHHAMPTGGTFRIVARTSAENRVTVTFSDTGHGMSAEVRDRIFEPFFTTKPAGQGTGLGLAVASDLVAAAGGSIDVLSHPGEGTTLSITLPQAR